MVKQAEKRLDLKRRLVEAATGIIEEQGIANMKAREVANRAGCALGGIYSAFSDLEELVMHVNSRTLNRLGKAIESAATASAPEELLRQFALAYYAFARDNRNLWSALFEHQMSDDREMPQWHDEEQAALIRFIIKPISDLFPDLSPDEVSVRARMWFSAVHGVVAINTRRRFISVKPSRIDEEIAELVATLVAGTKARG